MKRFKGRNWLPLIGNKSPHRQRGASLIAAIFVITALLAIGGLMTQLMVLGSEETVNEWYSAQALYAAESGVEWAAHNNSSGTWTNRVVIGGQAWFDVTVTNNGIDSDGDAVIDIPLYTITSIGKAGGTSGNPRSQRQIMVQFMP